MDLLGQQLGSATFGTFARNKIPSDIGGREQVGITRIVKGRGSPLMRRPDQAFL